MYIRGGKELRIEELAASHTIPGYDLVYFSEVAFPVWRVNLTLQMQEEIPLSVVDEFILKLMNSGLGKVEEISSVLGLREDIVRDSTIKLMKNDVVRFEQRTETLLVSDKGKEVLDAINLLVPEERMFSFYIDAITGDYCSIEGHQLFPTNVIKQLGLKSIYPSKKVPSPTEETMVFNKLEHLIKNMQGKGQSGAPKGRLLEILNFDKVYMMYSKLRVLVFYNFATGQYQYMVFDRDYRANEFDGILLAADLEEQLGILPLEKIEPVTLLPFSERITSTLQDEATRNLEELKKAENRLHDVSEIKIKNSKSITEVKKLQENVDELKRNTRILRVYEFRSLLNTTFDNALNCVILALPYLSDRIFDDDLLARLDKALQKGVKVYLFYSNEYNNLVRKQEKNVLEKLKIITSKIHGKYLLIKQINLKDDKIIICDDAFIVVGGHKWIETNPQVTQGIKVDNCVYTENKIVIKETIEELRLLSNLKLGEIQMEKELTVRKVNVFFSYSHKDELMRNELEKHLTMLKRNEIIATWHDRKIDAGSELDTEVDENIKAADVILLLVSADFLDSNYCYDIEMKIALERHEKKEARVIPVILRSCDWTSSPLKGLLALPTDGKSVSSWNDKDEAYLVIAKGIKNVVEKISTSSL